jgi:hypothetical protein
MTRTAMKKMKTLRAATIRFSPKVKREGPIKGKFTETAFSASAAKYHSALKKLASE